MKCAKKNRVKLRVCGKYVINEGKNKCLLGGNLKMLELPYQPRYKAYVGLETQNLKYR